jgi:hypothetical protein
MRNHSLLFFTLFICSLVVGYTFSARFYPSDLNFFTSSLRVVTAQDQKSIDTLSTGQRSFLLIGVSSLNTLKPNLESAWLATYLPTGSDVRLLSIYPTGNKPISDLEAQIIQSFGLDKKNGQLILNQDFQNVLVAKNYWWSGYIILDEVAMADISDLLGGIDMQGQILTGNQIITKLADVLDQPKEAYAFQIAMLQSICKQFSHLSSNADLSQVGTVLHHHIVTDLRSDQLRTEFQSFMAGEHQPTCKFPMLEKSQIVH